MLRVNESGSDLVLLTWTGATGARSPSEESEEAYTKMEAVLRERGAVPIQERVFGDLQSAPCVARGRASALGAENEMWAVPPTFVEGGPAGRDGLAGIHILAARAQSARLVAEGGRVFGKAVEGPSAFLVGLADVGRRAAGRLACGPAEEAGASIDAAAALLEREGFSFRDVARTWFYLRDILDWYGPFNAVRNDAFRRMGLMGPNGDGAIPASTGIEGRNARGGWCTLDLLAARGKPGTRFEMKRLHSRKQGEATEYGSAFARGMSLTLGDSRYVFVSGTAAIDDHGATVHVGDFEAQMRHTIAAAAAVLESGGARLEDLCQATSFLKNPCDLRSYERVAEHTGLAEIPALTAVADVCRPELLFEIDATAVVPRRRGRAKKSR